ncbi:hypothetical protein G7Y79_00053g088580 [Physcia stellaris]|nr:hypothetical protein G7Y79_00053g088580 [Physcia stellaris]
MSSAFEDYFRSYAPTDPEITPQDLWEILNILPVNAGEEPVFVRDECNNWEPRWEVMPASVNYVDDAMLYNNTSFDDNLTYHVDSDGNWQATHVNTTLQMLKITSRTDVVLEADLKAQKSPKIDSY